MKLYFLGLFGIGLLSGLLNVFLGNFIFIVFYLAGISYGIVTGMYFVTVIAVRKKYMRLLLWIVASTLSYIGACLVGESFGHGLGDGFSEIPLDIATHATSYALAGLVGAAVLAFAFHFIFNKLKIYQVITLLVTAALIPFLLALAVPYRSAVVFGTINIFVALFIIWQTVITVLLGMRPGALSKLDYFRRKGNLRWERNPLKENQL